MANTSSLLGRAGVVLAVLLISTTICLAGTGGNAGSGSLRSDIISIDLPPIPGGEKMPAVQFLHDRHTQAIGVKKDCSECHLKKEDKIVFKFKRTQDGDTESDMEIYHDGCIGCHLETKGAGKPSGPLAGDCRSCHSTKPEKVSSWQPIAFDRSLHFRHEVSGVIKPTEKNLKVNCGACHHKYDKAAEKTVYEKGEEESCAYCHLKETTKEASSLQNASHAACVNCHRSFAGTSEKAGPVNCSGCHDPAEQKKIEVIQSVPRLERNQPDATLLASWMAWPFQTQKSLEKHVKPVAFNHKVHEGKVSSCKTCHHASLARCGECHTETGSEKGGYIRLEQAMHNFNSEASCMGCHQQAQKATNCAGCHALMPEKTFNNTDCAQCHRVDKKAIVKIPLSRAERTQLAEKTLASVSMRSAMIPDREIPEMVKIDAMADQYKPAVFPHRQIVRKLADLMKDDKMADFFHGKEATTLCAGCHHNSPATTQPPKCASCHGESFKTDTDGRPGLMGAYHGQCISCHQLMKIEKPAATDCIGCHEKKG